MSVEWLACPALLVALAACAARTPERVPRQAAADTTIAFALERGACFGECPDYALSITRGGAVRIVGRGALASRPPRAALVHADSVGALLEEFERNGWFDLQDRFVPGASGCVRAASDHPSVTTTAHKDGRSKTVIHYLGCFDAPSLLLMLENRVDSLAGTGRWLSRP